MTGVTAPPTYENLAGDDGKASLPWLLFFNKLFKGDTGTDWTPTFTSLTQTGTPTITGKYYKLGESLAIFRVKIVPGTDTTAIAGTTYINNFPLVMKADGFCIAVSGLLGATPGMCDSASNHVYVPAWTTVSVPLTIIGLVEAS